MGGWWWTEDEAELFHREFQKELLKNAEILALPSPYVPPQHKRPADSMPAVLRMLKADRGKPPAQIRALLGIMEAAGATMAGAFTVGLLMGRDASWRAMLAPINAGREDQWDKGQKTSTEVKRAKAGPIPELVKKAAKASGLFGADCFPDDKLAPEIRALLREAEPRVYAHREDGGRYLFKTAKGQKPAFSWTPKLSYLKRVFLARKSPRERESELHID